MKKMTMPCCSQATIAGLRGHFCTEGGYILYREGLEKKKREERKEEKGGKENDGDGDGSAPSLNLAVTPSPRSPEH